MKQGKVDHPRAEREFARPLAAAVAAVLASQVAPAADAPAPAGNALEEIIVTAQKRTENLQDVPISLQALDGRALEALSVTDFDSYAKYLPSLSYQTYGPGQSQLYVRGVTNGGDGLRVGSAPLVGLYLDEQPVTTIGNNLDVHVYDIERVEALSGPQGTLFGASSMAGTLRIITRKPDPERFEAGYDLQGTLIDSGGAGGSLEGYLNLPLGSRTAVRLVGYTERDPGWIDNVTPDPPQVFPTSGAVRDNSALREQNFNTLQTNGARAALRFDLNDRWTITPTIAWQEQNADGSWASMPALGERQVARYFAESNDDRWTQAALTVEGRIGRFDVLYSGGYLDRSIDNTADYSDYSYYYDVLYPGYFGNYFLDNDGAVIDPSMYTRNHDAFTKQTHELRISSPQDARARFVAGLFWQRQTNDTYNAYRVDGLADDLSITGQPGVNYLNSQERVDLDRALFAEGAFDFTPAWTLTLGARLFDYDNSVLGFFGYGPSHVSQVGEGADSPAPCFADSIGRHLDARPCNNIHAKTSGSDLTYKANLTWRVTDGRMLYATYSTGFRPGGVNRNPVRPPYQPDTLDNYELGWKTEWVDGRLRWNGALFYEKWQDAQFGVSGPNNITEIVNAGRARIQGIESDVQWALGDHLMLSASATYLDAQLTTNSCQYVNPQFDCTIPGPPATPGDPPRDNFTLAPAGSRLPVSPRLKFNVVAHYKFTLAGLDAYVQGALVHQSDVIPVLEVDSAALLGRQPAYTTVDLSFGVAHGNWTADLLVENATDELGELSRYAPCAPSVCTSSNVVTVRPRTFALRFGQKF